MAITGFSFKKSKTGTLIGEAGIKILPNRIDKIKQLILDGNKAELDKTFFNFKVPDHNNNMTLSQLETELQLYRSCA